MGKFKLRNGSGNATPFKLMADMGFTPDIEGGPGGPGGGLPGIKNEDIDNKNFKAGAKAFIIDNYKETIDSKTLNVPEDEDIYYGEPEKRNMPRNTIANEITKQAIETGRQKFYEEGLIIGGKRTFKPTKRDRSRGKGGSVGGSIGYSTPWRRYRDAVKDFKQKEIKEKTDPFSKERRLAKQDLRGRFDSTGKRLSFKNKMQQKYLVGRRRGRDGNTQRGFHNPHIPEFKNRVSFAEWRQDRRNQKEKNQNAVASNLREGGNIGQRFKQKCKNIGGGQSCGVKERKFYFKGR